MPQPNLILRSLCAILAFSASAHAFASDGGALAQCQPLQKLEFPAADMPGPADMRALLECVPSSLYYGVGSSPDYRKAALCAHYLTGYRFERDGILAMLYANGQGVEKNYALARKAACSAGESPEEVAVILDQLATAERTHAAFDICANTQGEDVTTGCALVEANRKSAARAAKLSKLTEAWPDDQTAILDRLMSAETTFSDKRSDGETLGGPHRGARAITETTRLDDGFLYLLEQFESGKQLTYTEAQKTLIERELKSLNVQVALALKKAPAAGTTVERFQQSDKAWADYRDAWVDFARLRYPKVAKTTVIANLANARVGMLQSLLKDLRAANAAPR